MKKVLSCVAVMFFAIVLSLSSVEASDLTGQMTLSSLGLGNSVEFETEYLSYDDVNYVLVTLLVNENNINTILEQKPGEKGSLSMFYFELNPKLTGNNIVTANEQVWIGSGLTYETFPDAKKALDEKLDKGNRDAEQEIYPTLLTVQYSADGGKTWQASSGEADGKTSIKDNLIKHLGTDKLEYGKNYRFAMYDSYIYLCGWQIFDDVGQPLGRKYVEIEWEIKFPISGQIDDQEVFFISLEDALASGSDDIMINEDTIVDSNIVIPKGVWVSIADGATLEVKEGNTLTIEGKVYGDVRVDGVTKTYSSIVIMPTENGDILVDKSSVASGDLVTITSKAKEGYKLGKVVVIDLFNDKEINVVNGKFEMPAGPVEISAEFVVDTTPEVPNTMDNVMIYVAIAAISVLFIAGNVLYLKKNN